MLGSFSQRDCIENIGKGREQVEGGRSKRQALHSSMEKAVSGKLCQNGHMAGKNYVKGNITHNTFLPGEKNVILY